MSSETPKLSPNHHPKTVVNMAEISKKKKVVKCMALPIRVTGSSPRRTQIPEN